MAEPTTENPTKPIPQALNTVGAVDLAIQGNVDSFQRELAKKIKNGENINKLQPYIQAEVLEITSKSAGQETEAKIYQALGSTLTFQQLTQLSQLDETPNGLKQTFYQSISAKIQADTAQAEIGQYLEDNGTLNEKELAKLPQPVANAVISGYNALRQTQAAFQDPDHVKERIQQYNDSIRDTSDPQHKDLPPGYRKVNSAEWQQYAQSLQSQVVAADIFTTLSEQAGITPENVRQEAQTPRLAEFFRSHKYSKAQTDAFYDVVGKDLQTRVAAIGVDTAEANRTSAEAAASTANLEATSKQVNILGDFWTKGTNIIGTVLGYLGLGALAKYGFDWAAKQSWGQNSFVQGMRDTLDRVMDPVVDYTKKEFAELSAWGAKGKHPEGGPGDPQIRGAQNLPPSVGPGPQRVDVVPPSPVVVGSNDMPANDPLFDNNVAQLPSGRPARSLQAALAAPIKQPPAAQPGASLRPVPNPQPTVLNG